MINKSYYYKYNKYKTKYLNYKNKSNLIKVNLQPKNIININNSFNLISDYFKNSNNKYLNYELLTNIKSNSPSEYNRKDNTIYDNNNYKLFNMEDFLDSKWSFLDELLEKYDNEFENSSWFNNTKLSKDEFDNPN